MMPEQARGWIILGIAVLFRAARMIAVTPSSSQNVLDEAEQIVEEAEVRHHIKFL